uniref:Uncharacterized protein n=1 Tax=Cacopsylla melanoneura TaxID=428564 RepID=A0A8D9BRE3_9HEMI
MNGCRFLGGRNFGLSHICVSQLTSSTSFSFNITVPFEIILMLSGFWLSGIEHFEELFLLLVVWQRAFRRNILTFVCRALCTMNNCFDFYLSGRVHFEVTF